MLASSRATPPRRKRPGRIWSPPLQWVFRRAGIRPSHVAGRCRKACRGGACPSRTPRAAANTRGRDKSLPYEPRRARGQPGNHNLRVITNPCRGRCLHRPGQPRGAENAPGGYGIRPYNGFSAGRVSGLPVWPVVAGRRVGEGHAPPANPAPETRGFPGICGTYKTTVGRDALIPPHPAPPQALAGGINPSPTTHGGPAANWETTTSAL